MTKHLYTDTERLDWALTHLYRLYWNGHTCIDGVSPTREGIDEAIEAERDKATLAKEKSPKPIIVPDPQRGGLSILL